MKSSFKCNTEWLWFTSHLPSCIERRVDWWLTCSVPLDWQRCIINNTHRLVELCVAKLSQDWFPLLELLAMALNPHCKFHIYNGTRPSESVPAGVQLAEDELCARPPDPRSPKVFFSMVSIQWVPGLHQFFSYETYCRFQRTGNKSWVYILYLNQGKILLVWTSTWAFQCHLFTLILSDLKAWCSCAFVHHRWSLSLPSQGWLVDLINKFGTLNGFQTLHDRFMSGQALNVQVIAALIK